MASGLLAFAFPLPGIKHFPQDQAMRRGRHARHSAIFSGEHSFHGARFELALSNLYQRSDNATAHLVKESIALDDKCQQRAAAANLAARQGPHGAFRLVVSVSGEGFEVVPADE